MSDWIEFNSTPERDAEAKGQTVRTFKVWGAPRFAIYNNPTSVLNGSGVGLPGFNTSHPDAPALKLDRYAVTQTNSGGIVLEAQAMYSTDRRYSFPDRPPDDAPDFYVFEFSRLTKAINIPIIRLTKMTAAANDTAVTKSVYVVEPFPVNHTILEFTIRFNHQPFTPAEREIIRSQHDKLHKINDGVANRWYLFNGGNDITIAADKEQTTYSWYNDPGTDPFPVSPPDMSGGKKIIEVPDPAALWEAKFWVRPPFHELLYIPNQTDQGVKGNWSVLLPKVMNANGHLTLPGF